MKFAISQVCTLDTPFETDIEDFTAAKCQAVELWLTKLETYVDSHSVAQAGELLERQGIETPVASFQGGLFEEASAASAEHWAHFGRRLELCQQLGIGTMVVACDVMRGTRPPDMASVVQSLARAAKLAGDHAVRLALEFQAQAAFGNNLQTTVALVENVGSEHVGVCLDAHHFFVGPSKTEDLQLLTAANLVHVQVSDLLDTPRELATDSMRILPGDGDFDWQPLAERLHTIDYQGVVAVEVLNPRFWQISARSVAEIGLASLGNLFGCDAPS